MKTAIKSAFAMVAATAAIAGTVATPAAAVSTFNGRNIYSLEEVNQNDVGVTFNSIKLADTDAAWYKAQTGKDLPKGMLRNETNFVGARINDGSHGVDNVWQGDSITAEEDKEYVVRLYVHNNSQNQTAENVQVRFYVPYGSDTSQTVKGYLRSSNANPGEYFDTVTFTSVDGTPFHLEYVPGTALLENGGFASGKGVKLTDNLVNQTNPENTDLDSAYTAIGYNGLDGKIPGCYKYINVVTISVKAVYDREFTVEKKVRIVGDEDKTWKDTVEAKVGDQVEFRIEYINKTDNWHNQVAVRDYLPDNLEYVAGSTRLFTNNEKFQSGPYLTTDDLVQENGINIGNFDGHSNAIIRFKATVVDKSLACGSNTLVNWGQVRAGSEKQVILQDHAEVHLTKVCANQTKLPNAGPEAIVGGVIATGAVVTAAGYYIASRRELR